jgi:hypothetical protein
MKLLINVHCSPAVQIVLSLVLAGSLRGERVTVEVAVGAKACSVVNFPHRWRLPKVLPPDFESMYEYALGGSSRFEFRSPEGTESEALVSVYFQERGTSQLFSTDRYAFRMSGRPHVRQASEREWEIAGPMLPFHFSASERYEEVPDKFMLKYKGRAFAKTGEHWLGSMGGGTSEASRLSADARFLAVNSWSGVDLPGPALGEWWGGSNMHGQYFVDVYETDTGLKRIAIKGWFHGIGPSDFVIRSFWLGKSFFVLPLNTKMTKLLFCDVRKLNQ